MHLTERLRMVLPAPPPPATFGGGQYHFSVKSTYFANNWNCENCTLRESDVLVYMHWIKYGFSAKVFLILQLTDPFDIGVWKDIQAEEVQDKLKIYYTNLLQLVLNSKADNTRKNYMYNFKQFSVWCNKCWYKSVPAANHHVAVYLLYLMDLNPSASKINLAVYSIS